jgi:hypothetical protein|tara:strand:+ start:78 stop:434 length:357 start_codon:yes stop_codon:yes gene_type:complete
MSDDNVISFPKDKMSTPPQNAKELAESVKEFKVGHADQIAEQLWEYVLHEMIRAGVIFEKDTMKSFPSMVLILESIKSLHLLSVGIHHPLQDFANDSIDVEEFEKELGIVVDTSEYEE